ncbi:MAG: acetolactate synthase [Lachnospiraceae bacterium]|nr:acetolactate synthase [Lachnospiraceae bacterium]
MEVKQISVFVENKVGNLAGVAKVMSDAGISLHAISLADTRDFGVLRMLVDDTYNAVNVLRDKGYIFSLTPVIAVATSDEPGSLYDILTIFDEADINLEYLYDVNTGKKGEVYIIFKVSDNALAQDVLKKKGVRLVTPEELSE